MKLDSLSVFLPCYNEGKNLNKTAQKTLHVLNSLGLKRYELIVVNDGSSDQTGKIADDLAQKNSHIQVIHHRQNQGYGAALKSGFYGAKFDPIVYIDADGQFDFSEINKFIDKLDTTDLVIGYRIKRSDHWLRLLFAKGWALSLYLFFGLKLKDVDCGFKMVKKKVLQKIPHLQSTRGGMINAELAIKTQKSGFRIAQVGVNHYPRIAGTPTGVKPKVIIQSYIDLFKLWREIK